MSSLLPLRRGATAVGTLIAIASFVRAEDASPAPAPTELHANVSLINDDRASTGLSSCRLTLAFVGDEVSDTRGVLAVDATKAVDDLGRDLLGKTSAASETLQTALLAGRMRTGMSQPQGFIALRNPSRRAATIKLIEGTVDLFRPTEANDGVVAIPGGLAQRDKPIENSTLQKYGIELTCLSDEKAAEARHTLPFVMGMVVPNPSPEDEQRRLEAVAAEVARRRALREAGVRQFEASDRGPTASTAQPPSTAHATTTPSGASATSAATARKSTGTLPSSEGQLVTVEMPPQRAARPADSISVTIQIKDPQHKVVELQCQAADGRMLSGSYGTSALSGAAVLRFAAAPPADAKLVVYIAAPGAVERHPFKVENIALP